MDVLHERRGHWEQIADQPLHLLGHLQRVDALADQRLVHVEMEEAHLRLRDLADGLGVHPDELQHRDEREAGAEHPADPLHRFDVLLVERPLDRRRRPQQRHHALDQRLLEPGLLRRLRPGTVALPSGQQILDEAEREPALADGASQLGEASDRARASARPPGPGRRPRSSTCPLAPGPRRRRAQRCSVDGDTPAIRAASLTEIWSSGMTVDPSGGIAGA